MSSVMFPPRSPPSSTSIPGSSVCGGGDISAAGVMTHFPEQALFASDLYARLILAQMNKMCLRADFCDVRLWLGGRVFSVHKLVLAASSPYFSALFSGWMSEADKEEVQILGVEAQVFEVLLEFIYTGMINVTVENMQELMVAADMLQLSEFLEQIACMDMLEFTENYIHVHFLEVCVSDEFWVLSKDQLVKLLRSEELRIEDEYQVFTAAMDWVLQDVAKRKKRGGGAGPSQVPPALPTETLQPAGGAADTAEEVNKSPKENKMYSLLQPAKMRPRRKARKYLCAIGGYTRLQGGRWSDSRALSCVERFDSFSQYWTTVSSLHQACSGLGVAVLEGMIYVLGGEKDSMIFDCTERYDPVTKQWAAVASLNFPRCGVGVCPSHGVFYALGGWVGSEIGKTMERYDPTENKWEIIGSMAVPRYYFGCCELQGFIYSGGKHGGVRPHLPALERPARHGDLTGLHGRSLPQQLQNAVGGWNEALGSLETVEKYSPEEERELG
ncbi:hypothetical protein J4Q44_G00271830 [Coregonus suidteri]|uniref:BTB domain-containing protein n=1 Tax=Coregonus suidteri TaxID=861788 RepID=A0AAN8L3I1_9TELE